MQVFETLLQDTGALLSRKKSEIAACQYCGKFWHIPKQKHLSHRKCKFQQCNSPRNRRTLAFKGAHLAVIDLVRCLLVDKVNPQTEHIEHKRVIDAHISC